MSAIVIYENDGTVSYAIGTTPSTGPFAIDFPWFFANEITVTQIVAGDPPVQVGLVEGVDYGLTGVPADDGFHSGSVTLTAAQANCTIRIDRALRSDKASNFPETGAISIPGMNTLFSRLFSWIQDLLRRQEQAISGGLGAYLPLAGGTMSGHITLPPGPAADQAVRRDVTDALQANLTLKANIASPVLTGDPRSPTPLTTDAPSTRIATTAYIGSILGNREQGDGVWAYGGTVVADPGAGNYRIVSTGGANRTLSISRTDGDGIGRILNLLRPGDSLVFTTEITPVSGYARYDITGTPTNNPTWSQIPLTLTSMGSFPEAPAIGTRYRIAGFLNTAAGMAPITEIIAGTGLTGGGFTGAVTLASDTTLVPRLVSQAVGSGSTTSLNVSFPAGSRLVTLHWFLETATDTAMTMTGSIGGVFQSGAHYHLGYQLSALTVMSAGQVYSANNWAFTTAAIQSWGTATFALPYDGFGNGLVSVRDASASRAHYTMFFETDRSFSSFDGFTLGANVNLTANSFVRCFALT